MQQALGIDAAINAEDLALLDAVFSEWCLANGLEKSSVEAQAKAREIIALFEHGWKTGPELREMVNSLER